MRASGKLSGRRTTVGASLRRGEPVIWTAVGLRIRGIGGRLSRRGGIARLGDGVESLGFNGTLPGMGRYVGGATTLGAMVSVWVGIGSPVELLKGRAGLSGARKPGQQHGQRPSLRLLREQAYSDAQNTDLGDRRCVRWRRHLDARVGRPGEAGGRRMKSDATAEPILD